MKDFFKKVVVILIILLMTLLVYFELNGGLLNNIKQLNSMFNEDVKAYESEEGTEVLAQETDGVTSYVDSEGTEYFNYNGEIFELQNVGNEMPVEGTQPTIYKVNAVIGESAILALNETYENATYQWYRNSSNSTENGTEIGTSATYEETANNVYAYGHNEDGSNNNVGSYYYCKVTVDGLELATNVVQIELSYTITTAEQLTGFSALSETNDFENKKVWLGNDIEFNEGTVYKEDGTLKENLEEWIPFGSNLRQSFYRASFDGQGHKIKGIYSTKGGIFNKVYDGTIKGIKIDNSYINGDNVGGICNSVTEGTSITNCEIGENTKIEGGTVGGICGSSLRAARIEQCCNFSTINGQSYAGGIIGVLDGYRESDLSIEYSYNKGNITVTNNDGYAGGIAGVMKRGRIWRLL